MPYAEIVQNGFDTCERGNPSLAYRVEPIDGRTRACQLLFRNEIISGSKLVVDSPQHPAYDILL